MSTSNPSPKFVTLISSEGHRFILPREAAIKSTMINSMLSSGFSEEATSTIRLEDHRSIIVETVAAFLMHKYHYSEANIKDEIPDFAERVPIEIALELLIAADYMEC